MEDKKEYLGLLGSNFQVKLLGELLVPNNINKETGNIFFDEVIELINPIFFEKLDMRRIMSLIKEYYQKFKLPPNPENVLQMIATLNTSDIEKEELNARIKSIKDIWVKYKNGTITNDRDFIKTQTLDFIKQQEIVNVLKENEENLKKGLLDPETLYKISERFKKIIDIGSPDSVGDTLFNKVEELLVEDYREPIGTGNPEIDAEIDGGISKGEMCGVLAGQGAGKTSFLTYVANNAYLNGKNVLHVILEGKKNDIKRRHYSKLFKIKTSEFHLQKEKFYKSLERLKNSETVGNFVIEKLKDMTPYKLKKWVLKTEEKLGYKFDVICLDYINCLSSDTKTGGFFMDMDVIARDMERIVDEEQWRLYYGIQGKKEANNKAILTLDDVYGSAEFGKKCHLLLTIGRDLEMKQRGTVNFHNAKCRFAPDGQLWSECVFNGDFLGLEVNQNKITILEKPDDIESEDQKPEYINENANINKNKLDKIEI
jgi:hypothetical protein